MVLSKKLKNLRGSMSQAELARRAGVDKAIISKIESGKMAGTVDCHKKVASALGLTLSELYAYLEEKQTGNVEFRSGLSHSDRYGDFLEILTEIPLSKKMLPTFITLKPKQTCDLEESVKDVERFIIIIEGEVQVSIDKTVYSLKKENRSSKGDSLYSRDASRHQLKNTGTQTASLLCISAPPVL